MRISDTKAPTRQELSERTDGFAGQMERLHETLKEAADDIETVRNVIEQIDTGGGTAEGTDEVERSVDQAHGAAGREFDDQDHALEEAQRENEEYGNEVGERNRVTEGNLGRITDITAPLRTQDAVGEIRAAKEAMVRDSELLQETVNRIKENAEHSVRLAEGLRQVRGSRD